MDISRAMTTTWSVALRDSGTEGPVASFNIEGYAIDQMYRHDKRCPPHLLAPIVAEGRGLGIDRYEGLGYSRPRSFPS